MLEVSREQVTETTLTNLVQIGAIKPEEVEPGRRLLDDYSDQELVRMLLMSHDVREMMIQVDDKAVMPFFIISRINLN